MTCYIITYDLRQPGRDYSPLYAKIKSYNGWAKVTESTWAVVTDESAASIRDALLSIADSNDRIFVVKSGVEAAWVNSMCKNEWLKKHL